MNEASNVTTVATGIGSLISTQKDISLDSFENLVSFLITGEYDFATLTPNETEVLISFRKEKKEILSKHISSSLYAEILMKFKELL